MRRTFSDIQNSLIPVDVGIISTSNDFLMLMNEVQERLIYMGRWWGTCARFQICATSGCITLPRQIATIETVSICGRNMPIRDFWYRIVQTGIGLRDGPSCWPEAQAQGNFPTFTDISGVTSKLLLVCDIPADAGTQILVLGYDPNGNWIRTVQNGVWADGEVISLSVSPGTSSVNIFSSITDIQAPGGMDGQWWLYQSDTVSTTQILLGTYQYDETRPSYARYFFPSVSNLTCGSTSTTPVLIDCIGKLQFVPIVKTTDYMMIGNIPALKEMAMAVDKSRNEESGVGSNEILLSGEVTASRILNAELDHQLGAGRTIGINLSGSNVGEICPVPTLF